MKYLLVLGVLYQKYKYPAQINISSNDRLIDQFEINDDCVSQKITEDHLFAEHFKKVNTWSISKLNEGYKIPKFYKVYRLDESQISGRLKITVKNANTNFTNGFMTKNSILQFTVIALFPESMTENNCTSLFSKVDRLEKIRERVLDRYKNDIRFKVKPGEHEQTPSQILDNSVTPPVYWPILNWLKVTSPTETVQDGLYRVTHWIGSDFQLDIDVKHKYGIKYLHTPGTKTYGIWNCNAFSFLIASAKNLLNTYNENQRSNHTKD